MGFASASENVTGDDLAQNVHDDITGDEFRQYSEGTGKINSNMQVKWPDKVIIGEENAVNFTLPDDVDENAKVVLFINNQRVDDGLDAGDGPEYPFTLASSGTYGMVLKFMGDDYYAPKEFAKVYTLSDDDYLFRCEFEDEIIYGDDNDLTVYLPEDATGTITVDGSIYTLADETGYITIPLSNLGLGTNVISISYSGNEKYPSKKITKSIEVISRVLYNFSMDYDDVTFTLALPGNPQGEFSVTVDERYVKSSAFTNGVAKIRFDELPLGLHFFTPKYTGSDFNLDFTSQTGMPFDIVPKVTVDSFRTVDDENIVYIEFPDGFNTLVNITLSKYDTEYKESLMKETSLLNQVVNGSLGNFSFSKLSSGYYVYDISYRLASGYWDVYDRPLEGYIKKEFHFEVIPQEEAVADESSVKILFTHDKYAEGVVTIYSEGKFVDDVYLDPDTSKTTVYLEDYVFKSGANEFTAVFEGDNLYAPLSKNFTIMATSVRLDIPDEIVVNSDDAITLYAVKDATGYLAVYVDGKLFERVELDEGIATVSLADLSFNTHNIRAVYENGNYPSISKSVDLKVSYTLSMEDESFIFGGDNSYTIILPDGLTANGLKVEIDGETYGYSVDENYVYVDVSALGLGEHTITASHEGSSKFYPINVERTILVSAEIVIPDEVILGSNSYIYLILPNYPEDYLVARYFNPAEGGNVVASFGFDELDEFRSIARIPLKNLVNVGDYEFRVSYDGLDFEVPSKTETVHVIFNITFEEEIEFGQTQIIEIDLPDATGSIDFYLNNEYYRSYRLVGGGATVTLKTLEVGTYDFYITSDDPNYSFDYEGTFSVYPKFTVPKTVIDGNGEIKIDPGDYGEGYVTVYVDGSEFARISLDDGDTSISLKNVASGVHEIEVEYESYEDYFYDASFTVEFKKSQIIAKDMSMYYLDGTKYKVQIRDANGNAVSAGQEVKFYVDGKLFKTAKTDKNGYAYVVLTQVPKKYTVKMLYKSTAVSKKVTVKQILSLKKVTIKRSAKSLTLTATLKKVNGKYLSSKKITFKFNGKKYAAKTNKKGVAKVIIKKAVLSKLKVGKKITYSATYVKDTVKQSVKVKK